MSKTTCLRQAGDDNACMNDILNEDQEEVAASIALAPEPKGGSTSPKTGFIETDVRVEPLSACTIKMKLRSFLKDKAADQLAAKLDKLVMSMNRLMGEAYCFANHHIVRIMSSQPPLSIPKIDRNFFYRCLLAVSQSNARNNTLDSDFKASVTEFDKLRTGKAIDKVDVRDWNQVVADLSILMATMATNHLWMNLNARLHKYLKWRYPELKRFWGATVRAVAQFPKTKLLDFFPSACTDPKAAVACEVAQQLRALMPLASSSRFASQAHLTLPLYKHILQSTEAEKVRLTEMRLHTSSTASEPAPSTKAAKAVRVQTFTLLPTKAGYTISHVPISSMTLMGLLKRSGLEPGIQGDGRTANHRCMWAKYFNLNAVETRTKKFDGRILTDGYGVSVLMKGLSSPKCVCDSAPEGDLPRGALVEGVDPGFKDIVTVSDSEGKTWSYSSGQYYHDAGFKRSAVRVNRWTKETEDALSRLPTNETVDYASMKEYVKAYLALLPDMLAHRAKKGYRKMRFMRYCGKKHAIQALCDRLAPKGRPVYIGFGDWSGGSQSSVSRRTCGPLQEIKHELAGRDYVHLSLVDEFRTSQVCHCCRQKLCNMVADKTIRKKKETTEEREGESQVAVEKRRVKVHQVLHCRNSDERSTNRCGTTWNRDVNASLNMLLLFTLQLHKKARPAEFCRATPRTIGQSGKAVRSSPQPRKAKKVRDLTQPHKLGDTESTTNHLNRTG